MLWGGPKLDIVRFLNLSSFLAGVIDLYILGLLGFSLASTDLRFIGAPLKGSTSIPLAMALSVESEGGAAMHQAMVHL